MKRDTRGWNLAAAALALGISGCASQTPPQELVNARDAYQRAEGGLAQEWTPAQLYAAEKSLELAEQTFDAEGNSADTRDRAYVAMRKAQLANVQAHIVRNQRKLQALQKDMKLEQTQQLSTLRESYEEQQTRLAAEQRARKEAEKRAEQLAKDLAEIAQVKEEPRGTVITLSGSVLFASGETELLPAAQSRLEKVATALIQEDPGAMVVVEGHTDTQGSEEFNLDLSEKRAESVRKYLVSQGVAEDRIRAKGVGFAEPVAPNKTVEGRANNRRVEIIVKPPSATSGTGSASEGQDSSESQPNEPQAGG